MSRQKILLAPLAVPPPILSSSTRDCLGRHTPPLSSVPRQHIQPQSLMNYAAGLNKTSDFFCGGCAMLAWLIPARHACRWAAQWPFLNVQPSVILAVCHVFRAVGGDR